MLTVTLDRPGRRNALSEEMIRELANLLEDASTDESVRVVLLRGEGDHFCSGFDLSGSRRSEVPARAVGLKNSSVPCFQELRRAQLAGTVQPS